MYHGLFIIYTTKSQMALPMRIYYMIAYLILHVCSLTGFTSTSHRPSLPPGNFQPSISNMGYLWA